MLRGLPVDPELLALVPGADPADLPALASLVTPAGRQALAEAQRAHGRPSAPAPDHTTDADFARRLVTLARTDPRAAAVVRSALHRLCRQAPERPARHLRATAPVPSKLPAGALATIARDVEAWLGGEDAHGEVVVHGAPADDTHDGFALLVDRPGLPLSYFDGHAQRRVSARRRDGLFVAPRARRLILFTDVPALVAVYAAALGRALADDAALFTLAASVSLAALQRGGQPALDAARGPAFRAARVVAVVRDPGAEDTERLAGRDVLATAARHGRSLSEGTLVGATVRLDPAAPGVDPIDVWIRLPHTLHHAPSPLATEAWAFVQRLALDTPAEAVRGLRTAAPLDLPRWAWEHALGEDTARALIASRALAPITGRAIVPVEQPAVGRLLLAFPLGDGRHYAVPEDGFDVAPRVVDDDALAAYRLDRLALGAAIATEIGLAGTPRLLEGGALVDLGTRALGPLSVHAFLVVGTPQRAGLADRLRAVARAAHPVLLLPEGPLFDVGVAEVVLPSLASDLSGVLREIVNLFHLRDGVPAPLLAPPDAVLVISVKTGRAYVSGVEIALPELAFQFLLAVARGHGAVVPSAELNAIVSRNRGDDAAARQAKQRVERAVAKAFAGHPVPPPAIVRAVPGRGGYSAAVPVWLDEELTAPAAVSPSSAGRRPRARR